MRLHPPSGEDNRGTNLDPATVEGFGDEWRRFDQSGLGEDERTRIFRDYFEIFPWETLGEDSVGFDAGCGSGRWALLAADRVGHLTCIDASGAALDVARKNLASKTNVSFAHASVDALPLDDDSQDFGYSLGVLHHVPDTAAALAGCVRKLRPGAPFLVYLYYALDNRPPWFRGLWRATDLVRRGIARTPDPVKQRLTDLIAAGVYWPLARGAGLVESTGLPVEGLPLAYYRGKSFYTMRTDARDRFGTPLEQRFTRQQVERMMTEAGLTDIRFSDHAPYWCAVGRKSSR